MNKKDIKRAFFALLIGCCLSSCASIFTATTYPVVINSQPEGANIVVTNRSGKEIFFGKTPASLTLRPSSAYMRGEDFTVKIDLPGYDTKTTVISSKLEGWYFGNILLGGLIGMLIVDPLTGAMYSISDKEYNISLNPKAKNVELQIIDISTLDKDILENLVRIN